VYNFPLAIYSIEKLGLKLININIKLSGVEACYLFHHFNNTKGVKQRKERVDMKAYYRSIENLYQFNFYLTIKYWYNTDLSRAIRERLIINL